MNFKLFFCACSTIVMVSLPLNLSANSQEKVDTLTTESVINSVKKVIPYLPKVSGYMRIGYTYNDEVSNFAIPNARVDVNGKFSKEFDYRIFFDFATLKALDLRVRWNIKKEIGVCVGQFKVPFSLGNMLSPLSEECASFPLVLTKLVGFSDVCGVKATGRDIGISAYGNLILMNNGKYLIDYAVGVFNGNGMNLSDNNKSKDISGRIILNPMSGLVLSGSYYWGEYGVDYQARRRYSFGGTYDFGFASLRGEYISGVTGDIHSDGYYITAYGKFLTKLRPVFRLDAFTENKDTGTHQYNYTAGLDYRPFKFLRLQANYIRETFTALPSNNVCQLMLSGIF